jgi:hypothetical protein
MNRRSFLQSVPFISMLPLLLRQEKILDIGAAAGPNERICRKKFELAASLHLREKPINEVVAEMGKSFIGTAYAANTIEAPGPERLIVNLQTLDCVLLYESALVLARCVKKNATTYDDFTKELQFVRYRGGIIDGYPSRLHYTTDYFFDNEKKGVLKNVTQDLGGVAFQKKIDFMSTHPESYPRLVEFPEFVRAMHTIEEEISARTMFHIPKEDVEKVAPRIKDGDIIGITTSIEGLDCTHTGIAIRHNKVIHLLHAPISGSKVQITELPLWQYLDRIKKDTGIIVTRPLEP